MRVYYGHDVRKRGRGRKVTVVKVEEKEITRKKTKKGHVCERKNNPDISFLPFRIWHFFIYFAYVPPTGFCVGLERGGTHAHTYVTIVNVYVWCVYGDSLYTRTLPHALSLDLVVASSNHVDARRPRAREVIVVGQRDRQL